MSVESPIVGGARRGNGGRVEALLVDWQAPVLRAVEPERDVDHVMAMATVRGSMERLRRRGVRIAVVAADRIASSPPPYRRVESLLGPVDMWCVADLLPLAGASASLVDSQVATAAQALGVAAGSCALLTANPELAEAGHRAGMSIVDHGPIRPGRGAVAETVGDLSDAIDALLAERGPAPRPRRHLRPLPPLVANDLLASLR